MAISYRKLILPLLIILISVLILNIEQVLRGTLNLFSPVQITELKGVSIDKGKAGLNELEFISGDMVFKLKDISAPFNEQKHGQISIKMESLEVKPARKGKDLEGNRNNLQKTSAPDSINVSEFLPSYLYHQLYGVRLSISDVSINHPDFLNREIIIQSLDINSRDHFSIEDSRKNIHINANFHDERLPRRGLSIDASIFESDAIDLNVHFDKDNYFKVYQESIFSTEKQSISNKLDISIQSSEKIQALLNPYFKITEKIKPENLLFSVQAEYEIPNVIPASTDSLEQIFYRLNALGEVELSTNFVRSPFKKTSLESEFRISSSNDINTGMSAQLIFPEGFQIETVLRKNHSKLKKQASLAYLAGFPVTITNSKSVVIEFKDNRLIVPDGFQLDWSEQGNNSYLHGTLNVFEAIFKPDLVDTSIDYHLRGRWDKHFTTEHNGLISIQSDTSTGEHELEALFDDTRLNTRVELRASGSNEGNVSGDFKIDTSGILFNPSYINDAVSWFNEDLEIIDATINIEGEFDGRISSKPNSSEINYSINSSITDLIADYDGIRLNNIKTKPSIRGRNLRIWSDKFHSLQIDNIDTGILIENFKTSIKPDYRAGATSALHFGGVKARLMGGKLKADPFTLVIEKQSKGESLKYHSNFIVRLEDIELSEMLALAEQPEIQGNGHLAGELPITITDELNLIKNGWLKNKGKGYIRYVADAETRQSFKQTPQMALMIDVLSYLEYHELEADVNLNKAGIMTLKGRIKGVNPDYKSGYPINFNPLIKWNFNNMMKSLQISDYISKTIEEKTNHKTLD